MINDFDDFCLYVYVIVDDLCQGMAPLLKRPGPAPQCSDSELIALCLIGECKGWDIETDLLSNMQSYRHLFPHLPEQSRFNRRRRNLMWVINTLRRLLLSDLDVAHDRQCVIDSLPIAVVQFHLVPTSTADWPAYDATFGKVSTKKQTIYGYKLHLLVTLNGVIRDFELAPANLTDLAVGCELLADHTDLTVVGDKGYISAESAAELLLTNRIRLLTLPRANQKQQVSASTRRLLNGVRQIIETVNGQLTEQFKLETNHAHSFCGLCARLYTKLAAHTLCIYLNRLLGKPNFLQLKALAFPI
ncbi:MAG: IS982 family transposase [Chloroflexi bacterium]|nr:MAG: IS982 family transposase [Chloroflexota bacterium]